MNAICSVLVVASIAVGSVQAAEGKRSYNAQATATLQQKLDSVDKAYKVSMPSFLKEIDMLINQGANPNVGQAVEWDGKNLMTPLLFYLVMGPSLIGHIADLDQSLMEKVTLNALEHGADANAQDALGGLLGHSILGFALLKGSPAQVGELIKHGASLAEIKASTGNDPDDVLTKEIQAAQLELQEAQNEQERQRIRNEISRLEQNRALVQAASQKK